MILLCCEVVKCPSRRTFCNYTVYAAALHASRGTHPHLHALYNCVSMMMPVAFWRSPSRMGVSAIKNVADAGA